ncbi:MAG TPA: NAD(P)H-quinone oxidoreductase [Thermoanaerobaculia bacterium]|nr:NAD(P)H-quinone oxidoreductase [Thermoanaerobaculia bacterium]
MRAVLLKSFGDESVLKIGDVAPPQLGPDDIRISIAATAVNRADLLQRQGHYPPPPGASEILGLECAGHVVEVGSNVLGWRTGERAMALLPGGGYAEQAVVHAGSAMHVPDALSDEEAAAIPEVYLTAFLNIFILGIGKRGERLLIHGGGSGVGTAGTTLAKLAGLHVIVTAGSAAKCARCMRHGADEAIDYHIDDFSERARDIDIVLDHIGAAYLARDLRVLRTGGRVVIIGSMGGERNAEIDVGAVLGKRLQIIGSTLRTRSPEEKQRIVEAFTARFGEDLRAGRIRPVIDHVYSLEQVADAHRHMNGDHFGKIVLRVSEDQK